MTRTCTTCGHHTPETVKRGPLTVQENPPAAFWRGKPIDITRQQLKILHVLAENGEATHLRLEIRCLGEEVNSHAVTVQIAHLRKLLPPEIKIQSIHGWGYRLVIEEDA